MSYRPVDVERILHYALEHGFSHIVSLSQKYKEVYDLFLDQELEWKVDFDNITVRMGDTTFKVEFVVEPIDQSQN